MSSRSLRRVLSVSLVMVFLSLVGSPASGAASAFLARSDASFWTLAWQWLAEQIFLEEEPAPEAIPAAEADKGDAGWILDPNG